MSLTVKELLLNHSRGVPSMIQNTEAQYFDSFIPRFDDITDEIAHKENLKAEYDALAAELKQQKADAPKKAKAAKEAAQNAKKAQLAELQKEFPAPKPKDET
jgi:phage regulator Rha-like protein